MKTFDHYLALDWAQSNMAVAHMTKHSHEIDTIDVRSDIETLKSYLGQFKGSKILTFEEASPAQWLYTELLEHVDEIIVCEPYTNHLLKSGPKTDRTDAIKLLRLLRAEMLKPVFHCTDSFILMRKLVSGYDDLITSLVQLKNRRSAMFRSVGKKPGGLADQFQSDEERFVVAALDQMIATHEEQRLKYIAQFRRVHRDNKMVRDLASLPGIGRINAVKIAAVVVDPTRFTHATAFWLYCGLQKHELISGGRSYGKRSPRYSRKLKCVFKTAALVCTRGDEAEPLRRYYLDLIANKKYPEHQARHALARRIATLALGVMKSGKPLDEEELTKKKLVLVS
jgi:transposase